MDKSDPMTAPPADPQGTNELLPWLDVQTAIRHATGWDFGPDDCWKIADSLNKRIAYLTERRAPAETPALDKKYAHMCRADHVQVGYRANVHSADELNCPVCLLRTYAVAALKEAREDLAEAIAYAPDYFREKWSLDRGPVRIDEALAEIDAGLRGLP